jgi:hypothetical protein
MIVRIKNHDKKKQNGVSEMNEIKRCILCENSADTETWDSGNRIIFYCSATCPTFQITRHALKELEMNPHRKPDILQKIKAFTKENPNDMPVIRMIHGSTVMKVTTRSREKDD